MGVSVNGEEVSLPGGKSRALLALLLLHANETVALDHLIMELWGEDAPPETARNVHVLVSRLRRAFADANADDVEIATRAPGYALLAQNGALDVMQFEATVLKARDAREPARARELFEAALGQWQGPPLENARETPELEAAAARLEDRRLGVLEERVDADLALGRERELVPELEALVAGNPLRERMRAQLMLALYRSGRQADALAVYQDGRRALDEQLGLAPGPELRRLEQQILDHDPELAGPAAQPPAARRPTRWALVALAGLAAVVAVITVIAASGGDDDGKPPPHVGRNRLVAIDPATNKVTETVAVGRGAEGLAVTPGAVWVINFGDKTLSRFDLKTHRLATIGGLPQVDSVVGDPTGGVWVSGFEVPIAAHVDERSLQIDKRVRVRARAEGLAVGGGYVWVTNPSAEGKPTDFDTVTAIDLRTRKVARTVPVGTTPIFDAFGYGALWTSDHDDATVSVVTPGSAKAEAIDLPGANLLGIAAGAGGVWVVDWDHSHLIRIDPVSRKVVARIPVGAGALHVATGAGSVWVTSREDGTVSRIDPRTNRVVAKIRLGPPPATAQPGKGVAPWGITFGAGKAWVATQACDDAPCIGG